MNKIWKMLNDMAAYLVEASVRLVRVNDDSYPATGVQPFEGTPVKDKKHT